MRIIGGKYRSRVLVGFEGDDVRPTSDRAREALFNILSSNTCLIWIEAAILSQESPLSLPQSPSPPITQH